jgi:hypothetical protein
MTIVIAALWFLMPQPAPPHVPNIDFTVTTSDGTPVTDVKMEEVSIRIDGRMRRIRSLRLVSVSEIPQMNTSNAPAPFGTNALTSDGRSLVIAIDEDSFRTGREQALRESVDGLISSLGPSDRVLVLTMPFGSVKIPFTTDHVRVKRFISAFTGQRPQNETGSEMACRTRRVLEATAGFLGLLGFAQGPTAVVFFTGGMAGPRRDAIAMAAPGMCELTAELFSRLGRAAGAARANFYVVHPSDLAGTVQTETISGTGFVGSNNPLEGIEHLAGVTGGRRLPLSSAGGAALARIAKETAAHYVAELEPEPGDGDTRSRQVNIRASRANVTVGFRPQTTLARPSTAAATPTASAETAPNARQMLMTTTPFGGLPLRAGAFTAVGTGGKVKVTALAEPVDPAARLTAVMAALIDPTGRVAAQWAAPDPTEVPLSGAMLVDPGTYRLRVTATDNAGRGGAADYEFDARLTAAGTLHVSSLILGVSHSAAFVPRLQFGREPVALASLELSGQIAGPRLALGLDLARTVDGPAIVKTPLAIERIGEDHYMATGAIAIGALPPGDYVVRAVVGVEGQAPVRVTRTLRKVTP